MKLVRSRRQFRMHGVHTEIREGHFTRAWQLNLGCRDGAFRLVPLPLQDARKRHTLSDARHFVFFRFGLRFACASAAAIGARSFFGVFGSRKSLPAFFATVFEVVIRSFPLRHESLIHDSFRLM
jgi:hypothetical protein